MRWGGGEEEIHMYVRMPEAKCHVIKWRFASTSESVTTCRYLALDIHKQSQHSKLAYRGSNAECEISTVQGIDELLYILQNLR